jgi:hypothetical protein
MKENPADVVTNEILARVNKVSERISKQLKNTKPFAREMLPARTKIWAVDNLGLLDMEDFRKEFGDEAISKLLYEVEKLKSDGRRQ